MILHRLKSGVTVLQFGNGQIGSAFAEAVVPVSQSRETIPHSWDAASFPAFLSVLSGRITSEKPSKLIFLWAAGSGGFAMTERQAEEEMKNFSALVKLAERHATEQPTVFHLLSSAGGLFEGQRLVDEHSSPLPLRVYGRLKLAQEEMLEKLTATLLIHIHRPSSVFSRRPRPGRRGLINVLIENHRQRRVTPIFGSMHTLRDYVAAEDIGRHLVESLDEEAGPEAGSNLKISLLTAGRSHAIAAIIRRLETIFRHRLYVNFIPQPDNQLDNTFRITHLTRREDLMNDLEIAKRNYAG